MRLREWIGIAAFSILLHLVIFWPLPAPSGKEGGVRPLIVSLPEVRQPDTVSGDELVFVESSDLGLEAAHQVVRQISKSHPKRASNIVAEANPKTLPSLAVAEDSFDGELKPSQPEKTRNLVGDASKKDFGPSISRYRLAIAAEVIRMRASVERLMAPDFQGKIVVLVQLRGVDTAPLISMEETAGSEPLDREVLAVFRRAADLVPVSITEDVGEVSIRLPVYLDQAVSH